MKSYGTFGADRRKIHVIYVSYSELCRVLRGPDLSRIREKYALPEHFVLFLGGFSPLKNLSNLLKAFEIFGAELPHSLVLTGFKRWRFQDELDLIESLETHDRILMTGYVPDADLPGLCNLADLFVLPSPV